MLIYNMKNYEVIQGDTNYLFSAPHPYPHRRPSLVKKYKVHEQYTDDIVRDICRKSNSFGIYIKDQVDYDPNYHKKNNPYKKEVEKIITENKIKNFIDIHGLCDEHMIDIAIYYKTRFRKSVLLAEEISEKLNRRKLKGLNIQILRLPENDSSETLTELVASKLRVPAIQIEIARYIRKDKELREAFVMNLSEIVSKS
jgi:hypothetical protein